MLNFCTSDQCCCEMPWYRVLQTVQVSTESNLNSTQWGEKNLFSATKYKDMTPGFAKLREWSITTCSLASLRHPPFPAVRNSLLALWCSYTYPGNSNIFMSYSLLSWVLLHLSFRREWGVTKIINIPEISASILCVVIMVFQFSFLVLNKSFSYLPT